MLRVENAGKGLQREDDGRAGPIPLLSEAIGVAVQVSLKFPAEGRGAPATEEERMAIYGLYDTCGMPMLERLKAYIQA